MGFEVPNKLKVDPNISETLFKRSWDIFGSEVTRMLDQGWKYSLRGKTDQAERMYKGANIYFYMVFLAQAARQKLLMLDVGDTACNSAIIDEQYGLSCIEAQWPCLSQHFDTDYRSVWNQIMELFGIDRDTSSCAEDNCCQGIGQMIISDREECGMWVIGGCTEADAYTPGEETFGEWGLGEFGLDEFTNFNETE
jgi:hypothetical protein